MAVVKELKWFLKNSSQYLLFVRNLKDRDILRHYLVRDLNRSEVGTLCNCGRDTVTSRATRALRDICKVTGKKMPKQLKRTGSRGKRPSGKNLPPISGKFWV